MMRYLLALCSLSLLAGCAASAPVTGGACGEEGAFVCDPTDRFWGFECNDGKWRDVFCDSTGPSTAPLGCVEDEFDTQCHYNMVQPGDPCWTRYEGTEFCSIRLNQRDIKLTCLNGTWESSPCPSCRKPSGYPVECGE